MMGLLARWASIFGALMLLFYFIAYPPIPGYMIGVISEGSYLWVNKTMIEFFVLVTFAFVSSDYFFGIDRLYKRWKDEKARQPVPDLPAGSTKVLKRREAIKDLIAVPAIGAFAYALYKKKGMG